MLFPTLNVLYIYISTSRSTCAVPHMAVFCSALIWYVDGMLLRYFVNDFETLPVASCYYRYHFCFYIPHAIISITSLCFIIFIIIIIIILSLRPLCNCGKLYL